MSRKDTNSTRPPRILLSAKARDRLGGEIAGVMDGRPFELVTASPTHGGEPEDVDVAFITRDVTGRSTKHVVLETLESFYNSLRRSPALRWVHVHSTGADRPIFAELRAADVAAAYVGQFEDEHERIHGLVAGCLGAGWRDPARALDLLLRAHIGREETDLFPAAHQMLCPAQWEQIDRRRHVHAEPTGATP